jgi:hypothetical protein
LGLLAQRHICNKVRHAAGVQDVPGDAGLVVQDVRGVIYRIDVIIRAAGHLSIHDELEVLDAADTQPEALEMKPVPKAAITLACGTAIQGREVRLKRVREPNVFAQRNLRRVCPAAAVIIVPRTSVQVCVKGEQVIAAPAKDHV